MIITMIVNMVIAIIIIIIIILSLLLLLLLSLLLRRKEGNVLFNDALNTFSLRLYGIRHMVKDHSDSERETRCRHIGYSFQLTARVLLYAPSHRQDSTYHDIC